MDLPDALLGNQMAEHAAQQPNQSPAKNSNRKIAGAAVGTLALGALGTAAYVYREELKRFFKFGQYANSTIDDSANLVVAKLGLAINMCDSQEEPNLKDVIALLLQAQKEARALVNVNQRLQDQLDKVTKVQLQ
jgi:hypothetical protein